MKLTFMRIPNGLKHFGLLDIWDVSREFCSDIYIIMVTGPRVLDLFALYNSGGFESEA